MMATRLSRSLVAPSKVANILDWRKAVGSVMGVDITRDRIGLAVAEHPEQVCKSTPLSSIPIRQGRDEAAADRKGRLPKELVTQLEAAVRKHRVAAFIVNWPVHEGRMGGECGKVLQVLDSVIDQSNSVVTKKRPFALWCHGENASRASSPIDEWGRSKAFARAPEYVPGMNFRSKSDDRHQPENSSIVAANVLDEWVKNHWEIDHKMCRATAPKTAKSDFFFSTHSVDEYNSEQASLQAALL
ncbi:hypothetical protein ACHAXT_000329 [Thalassiosira profunda]